MVVLSSVKTDVLPRLRALFKDLNHVPQRIHAYIVPSEDAHQSEYVADSDKRRAFISGFTGSRGLAVITENSAALYTDGRYFLQASQQMSDEWTLMKEGLPDTPKLCEWLLKDQSCVMASGYFDLISSSPKNAPSCSPFIFPTRIHVLSPSQCVGIDPFLITAQRYREWERELAEGQVALVPVQDNLIDIVWADERPATPCNPLRIHSDKYAGSSWNEKLNAVRQKMSEQGVELLLLSTLDEIAWLLNLRGSDIDFNPLGFGYVLISKDRICFFADEEKITPSIEAHLHGCEFSSYTNVADYLKSAANNCQGKVWLPNCSQALAMVVPQVQRLEKISPVQLLKACKNQVELNGMRNAHLKDAAAHVKFLCWLEEEMRSNRYCDELKAETAFENFRKTQDDYVGLSFETIAAVGPNAAVIHYHPTPQTNRPITKQELFLVDSGAQYLDGTTDVTRTVCFGQPSAYQRECYTRVLKAHLQLASLVFPENSDGYRLDSISRIALWNVGLDYLHGTGHGVGSFLCVHEGPAGFHMRESVYTEGIRENMCLTIEPGYYEDGNFGIRIENVYITRMAETPYRFKDRKYLCFEPITLVPFERKLLEPSLLNEQEIKWINDYHSLCAQKVGPLLDGDELRWLMQNTKPLD